MTMRNEPITRIDAPQKIIDGVQATEKQILRMQGEINGIVFGAAAALSVPDGWQWDGRGWIQSETVDDTNR